MFGDILLHQYDKRHALRRKRLLTLVLLLIASAANALFAGPPRLLDDDDLQFQPAAFDEPAQLEPSRQISPRNKGENAARKAGVSAKKNTAPVSLWGTVIGLMLVFGMFLGARVWLTKHGPIGFRGLPTEAMELLGKRLIEPRVSVHLARCGPKILVLGVSPDGIRLLTEITDPVEVDLLAGACRRNDADKSSATFTGMFRQAEAVKSRPMREEGVMRISPPRRWMIVGVPPLGGKAPAKAGTPTHSPLPRSGGEGTSTKCIVLALRLILLPILVATLIGGEDIYAQTANRPVTKSRPPANRGAVRLANQDDEEVLVPPSPEPANNGLPLPPLGVNVDGMTSPQGLGATLKVLLLLTVLSLAPAILMMTTCFIRFVVVMSLLRQVLGTQQLPPNQVVVSLCLFLTVLVMAPVWNQAYQEGIQPYTSPAAGERRSMKRRRWPARWPPCGSS